jgi:hypothetical protein
MASRDGKKNAMIRNPITVSWRALKQEILYRDGMPRRKWGMGRDLSSCRSRIRIVISIPGFKKLQNILLWI